MKTRKNIAILFMALLITTLFHSCKNEWLEAKPDKALVVPKSVGDFQALLDNSTTNFNRGQAGGLGEIGAGDFYVLSTSWQSLFTVQEKTAYIWAPTSEFYKGEPSPGWSNSYIRILNANIVLYGIENAEQTTANQQSWNNVKGSALFYRAFDFYNLAQEFCRVYTPGSNDNDPGLPLRLNYDVNVPSVRSSLKQTYSQIISDLKLSSRLLGSSPAFKTRPSKQAAFGLLARTYLSISDYHNAGLYADSALQIQHDLLNYSQLNTAATNPVPAFNAEVIFQSIFSFGIFSTANLIVEPDLYNLYTDNDIRKQAFFISKVTGFAYKGSYSGDKNLFGGLATDEMYLIRAEANARAGQTSLALKDYNDLRRSRWSGTYTDLATTNANAALVEILKERRRELIFRSLRWTDLRRLNKEDQFKTTLSRTLNGQVYTLIPNDPRYVFPIDETEIRLSGIPQNIRE